MNMRQNYDAGQLKESFTPEERREMTPLENRIKPGYDVKDGCLCKVKTVETDNGNPSGKKERKTEYTELLNGVIELTGQTTTDNGLDTETVLNLLFHCANGENTRHHYHEGFEQRQFSE